MRHRLDSRYNNHFIVETNDFVIIAGTVAFFSINGSDLCIQPSILIANETFSRMFDEEPIPFENDAYVYENGFNLASFYFNCTYESNYSLFNPYTRRTNMAAVSTFNYT